MLEAELINSQKTSLHKHDHVQNCFAVIPMHEEPNESGGFNSLLNIN